MPLRKVCRRPETEYRLLKLQSYGKNPAAVAAAAAADPSQGASKAEAPPTASAGETAASSATVKGAESNLGAVATGTSSIMAPEPVTSSAMEVDATPVQSAGAGAVAAGTASASVPSSVTERVDPASGAPETVGAAGAERVGPVEAVAEPAKQLPTTTIEAPSLQAPPEMFNSDLESIVVLEKSDLEGISKS